MAWTAITNPAVAAGAAVTTSLMTAFRDNIILSQGALKPLAEETISSDATVDFTQFDNSIYRGYRFVFESIKTVSSPVNFEMLMSTDGGSTFQTNYIFRSLRATDASVTSPGSTGATQVNLVTNVQNTTGTPYGISGTLDILNAGTTERTSFHSHFSAQDIPAVTLVPFVQMTDGWSTSATDTDAVRFQLSAGNMASGTIKMYGILDTIETA